MILQCFRRIVVCSVITAASLCVARSASAVASAELFKTAPYRYGRFSARIQFPAGDGVVGSFFLYKSGSEKSGVIWNELDFEKIKADCVMNLNSIWGSDAGISHDSHAEVPGGACSGFHTYTFEWTPTDIVWFVDGKEVRRDTGDSAKAYVDNALPGMLLDFNNWPGNVAFAGNFSDSILPVHQYISWVEYWAHTPGAGPDGSNFTLTWRESFEKGSLPSGWATGTWASPHGLSTHSATNVKFMNGVAVLSLTKDDAKGFTGTPPVDSGDLPSSTGSSGSAGAGGGSNTGGSVGVGGALNSGGSAGVGGSTSSGGTTSAGGKSGGPSGGSSSKGGSTSASGGSSDDGETKDDSGCSCRTTSQNSTPSGMAAIGLAIAAILRRSRRRE